MENVIVGLTGTVTFKDASNQTLTQRLASISVSTGQALFDISAYGSGTYVERIAGLKDLAGTAAGFLTSGQTGSNPFAFVDDVASLTIVFDTNCSLTFPAVVGSLRVEGSFSGLNVVTFDWAKAIGADPVVSWTTT